MTIPAPPPDSSTPPPWVEPAPDAPAYRMVPAEPCDQAGIAQLLAFSGLPAREEGAGIGRFMVIRSADDTLLGCAACEHHGSHAVIDVVAVLPQARGCGVGTALVYGILRWMIRNGVQSVCLLAPGAEAFFGRFGFLSTSPADLPPDLVTASGRIDSADPEAARPMLLHLGGSTLVGAATREDMPAVLSIYNGAVAHSTATYDYEPRMLEEQVAIFEQKMLDGFGFFVARTPDGTVAGFSTYGLYRTRPGWRFACEHSVYVAAPWRGRRVGLGLLAPVMRHARRRGFHTMIGVVDAANAASVGMHRRAGFTEIGTLREGGYKFGRWLDVAFLQAML